MENKNAPAYPQSCCINENGIYLASSANASIEEIVGVTKREYFAVLAMQGFLSSYSGALSDPKAEHIAKKSLEYADALLLELSKPQP